MTSAEAVREPLDFATRIVREESEVVVAVEGQIDLATVPLLWGSLEQATAEVSTRLIVDISATTFVDSTGVAVFLMAHNRLRGQGAELVLRSPTPAVLKVFQVAGLDRVLVLR